MKRFIMSYTMLRAVRLAEGSVVGRGPLALWTILGNRWPVLAEHLQEHPEAVTLFWQPPERFSDSVPQTIVPLFTDPPDSLKAVMNHPDGPLTAEVIQECCGQLITLPSASAFVFAAVIDLSLAARQAQIAVICVPRLAGAPAKRAGRRLVWAVRSRCGRRVMSLGGRGLVRRG